MPELEKNQIYRFAEYRLNTGDDTLSKNGEKIVINRRAFQVLRLLVERAGQIVSKQEFFDTVWANTFVEDNVLTVTMTTLRKALNENPKTPQFIETLPRKGYRFIGEVTVGNNHHAETKISESEFPASETETYTSLSPSEEITRGSFSKRKYLFGIGLCCLIILACIFGFSYFSKSAQKSYSANSAPIQSVAVLPFENKNPDTDYLSDGLTENVIDTLAALPNLRVISRNSVFEYKGKETELAEVGRELNVQAAVTGRFEQRGDDLIINVELTDLRDNKQIWGRQYNRSATNVAALQQEVTRDLFDNLRLKSEDADSQRLAERQTDNPEAFQLYLKGRYEWNKRSADGFVKAADYFNQAIDKDPTYALAYDGLAKCYTSGRFDYTKTTGDRAALVKEAARKALEINPNLGEVYATLALSSYFNEWDFADAERNFKRSLELAPNYATGHHWYAEFLAAEGRFDESFAEYQKALALDPLSLAIQTDLGFAYYYAHQYDRAIEYLQKLKELNPNYPRTYLFLSEIYEKKGMYQDSIEEFDRGSTLYGTDPQYLRERKTILENALKLAGGKGYWLTSSEYPEKVSSKGDIDKARFYTALGEYDKAFESLEKAYAIREAPLVWLKVSPAFDGLRSDPRYADLVRRIGIP